MAFPDMVSLVVGFHSRLQLCGTALSKQFRQAKTQAPVLDEEAALAGSDIAPSLFLS
jgi:hypothetical protein